MFVFHIEKFQKSDILGLQKHNQREAKNSKNKDIDYEKSNQNYDLKNEKNISYNEKINIIIATEKTDTRKIRADAVLMCSGIVSADKDFFEKLSKEEQERFFSKAYEFLENRYGRNNVIAGMVHNDEKTPHMHFSFVPIRAGKLSAKDILTKQELRNIQKELPEYLAEQGFPVERGMENSPKKHTNTHVFKKEQLKQEVEHLQVAKKQIQKDIISLKISKSQVLSDLKNEEEQIKDQRKQVSKELEEFKKLEIQRKQALEQLTKFDEEIKNKEKSKEKIEKLNDEILTIAENIEKTYHTTLKAFSDKINDKMHTKLIHDALAAKYGTNTDGIIREMSKRRFRPEMIGKVMLHNKNFDQKKLGNLSGVKKEIKIK